MRTRTVLSTLLLTPALALGQAATAPATAPSYPNAAEIQSLIKKLSDDSYQTRQDAQDQLVRYGPDAKPSLQQLLKQSNDPEARTRAESALAQIDDNRTTGPSLVTLHVKDAPADMVLQDLGKQAMYPIPTMPENLFKQEHINWPKVTLDVDRQPFWTVFREYCKQTQLRPNSMGNDRKFILMQGGDESLFGPFVTNGPFMVVANNITRSSSVNLARDKTPTRSLNMQFSIFAEPKLNILGHDYYIRITEAVDDKGNSLTLPSPAGYNSIGQDPNPRWSVNASLAMPADMGTRLARIKGVSRAMMQTKSETWEVPDIATAQTPSKSISGRKYVVEEFRTGDSITFQLKLSMLREGPRTESWNQYGRGVKVTLADADGKPLAPRGYGGGGSDEKLTYTYTFSRDIDGGQKTGAPAKLVVEVPTEVREVAIPFEFTDLPLP